MDGILTCNSLWLVLLTSSIILVSLYKLYKEKRSWPPLPPGPAGLPIIGHLHLMGPVPHRSMHLLAQKYGPIFLIHLGSRPTIVISSPSLAKDFLHHHDHSFSHRPPSQFAHLAFHGSQNSAFMDQTPRWRALRKLYAQHIVSAKNVAASAHIRHDEIGRLLQALRSVKPGVSVQIRASVFDLMLNVMTRVVFSERAQGQGLEEFPAALSDLSELFARPLVADFVPSLRRLFDPRRLEKRVVKEAARMDALMDRIVRKRLAQVAATGSAPSDILTTLLQFDGKIVPAAADSSCLLCEQMAQSDNRAVKALLLELLAASTDNSTAVVEWAMAELLWHRESILQKLKEELNTVVGEKQVEEEELSSLPYLEAVMKEVLRLHPPGSTLLPHFAKEATEVAGYAVPEKTMLIVNAWAIGRDESVWEEAQLFKPERFVAGGCDSHISLAGQHNYQLLAFGKGRRACPGRDLGLMMASLAVANLVHSFDWHTTGLPDLQEKMSAANMLVHPLVLTLSPTR